MFVFTRTDEQTSFAVKRNKIYDFVQEMSVGGGTTIDRGESNK